ncbi:MAG: hypothetical protein A2Z34_03435 [Planctomycetes bacterium RBG_16_59_8]|nr:MAG: hypothetical protein A2Z34_03435 [Planctomycetes bacterium RBG_16_59_8]
MKRSLVCLMVAFIAVAPLVAQEKEPMKEIVIVELNSGEKLIGVVTELTSDAVKVELKDGGTAEYKLKDVKPYSVFPLRKTRIDDKSAAAHAELGDFAFENNLYPQAVSEYAKAIDLDGSLKEKLEKKLSEAKTGDAKILFEDGIALAKKKQYEDAVRKLTLVRTKYPSSAYDAQAAEELEKVAAIVKELNEKKRQDLEEAKKRLEDKLKEKEAKRTRTSYDEAIKAFDGAKKLVADGLALEAKNNVSATARSWTSAEGLLLRAKDYLDQLAAATKDVDIIEACKDKKKEIDTTLIQVYNHLGNLWLTQFNTPEARRWINQALLIDPNDATAVKLKLLLTEIIIREKLGTGEKTLK